MKLEKGTGLESEAMVPMEMDPRKKGKRTVEFMDLTVFDFVPESALSPEQTEKAILELRNNEKNVLVPYRVHNENIPMPIPGSVSGSEAGIRVGIGIGVGVGYGNKNQSHVKNRLTATELAQEAKILNLRARIATHEHQIGQLQKDNSKRLESYEQLKQKCNTTANDLQEQLYGIQRQVQGLRNNAINNQAVLERLEHCEAQNAQHDAEFGVVNEVMVSACNRMDVFEERQRAQWECIQKHHQAQQIQMQQQQEYIQRQFQQDQQSQDQGDPLSLAKQQYFLSNNNFSQQLEEFEQTRNSQAEKEPSFKTRARQSRRKCRSVVISTSGSEPSKTSSNRRGRCRYCNKLLSSSYVKKHMFYHCPFRPSL